MKTREEAAREISWKIIRVSNYDNPSVDDKLVCDNITDYQYGFNILNTLLTGTTNASFYYYRLVPSDYVLYIQEP